MILPSVDTELFSLALGEFAKEVGVADAFDFHGPRRVDTVSPMKGQFEYAEGSDREKRRHK